MQAQATRPCPPLTGPRPSQNMTALGWAKANGRQQIVDILGLCFLVLFFFLPLNIASRLLVTLSFSLFLSSLLSICLCLSPSLSLSVFHSLSLASSLFLFLSLTPHSTSAYTLPHVCVPNIATSKSLCINNVRLLCSKIRG